MADFEIRKVTAASDVKLFMSAIEYFAKLMRQTEKGYFIICTPFRIFSAQMPNIYSTGKFLADIDICLSAQIDKSQPQGIANWLRFVVTYLTDISIRVHINIEEVLTLIKSMGKAEYYTLELVYRGGFVDQIELRNRNDNSIRGYIAKAQALPLTPTVPRLINWERPICGYPGEEYLYSNPITKMNGNDIVYIGGAGLKTRTILDICNAIHPIDARFSSIPDNNTQCKNLHNPATVGQSRLSFMKIVMDVDLTLDDTYSETLIVNDPSTHLLLNGRRIAISPKMIPKEVGKYFQKNGDVNNPEFIGQMLLYRHLNKDNVWILRFEFNHILGDTAQIASDMWLFMV